MSDDSIKMSFVADDKEMLAAYRSMQKEVEKLKKANSDLTAGIKDQEQAAKEAAKAREEAAKAAAKAEADAAKAAVENAQKQRRIYNERVSAFKAIRDEEERGARAHEEAARKAMKAQEDSTRQAARARDVWRDARIAARQTAERSGEEAQKRITEEAKRRAMAAKQQTDAFNNSPGGRAIADLRATAAGYFAVTAVVDSVISSYRNLRMETERLGESHRQLSADMTQAIAKAGDLASGSKIEKALDNVPGATSEQALSAYRGVTQGSPSLSLDRRLEIAKTIAPLAPTGHDIGGLSNVAGKLAGFMPTKSADDLADIAVAMQHKGGENFEKFGGDKFLAAVGKLTQAGVSPERALGIGVAGVEANLPSGVIAQLAEAMVASNPNKGRPALGAEDRAKQSFYKLSPWQRYEELTKNDKTRELIMGAGGMLELGAMGDGSQQEKYLSDAQASNAATGELDRTGGFARGRGQLRDQESNVQYDRATRIRAIEEARFKRAANYARSLNANRGALSQLRIETEIAGVGYGARGGNLSNFQNQAPSESLLQGMQQMGYMSKEQAEHFRRQESQNAEVIAELKKLNASRSQEKKTRVVNIDKHTEN